MTASRRVDPAGTRVAETDTRLSRSQAKEDEGRRHGLWAWKTLELQSSRRSALVPAGSPARYAERTTPGRATANLSFAADDRGLARCSSGVARIGRAETEA